MNTKFLAIISLASLTVGAMDGTAQTITGDLGTTGVTYGSPLSVQTINTGFGDNSGAGDASGGSELDAAYGSISDGNLYLFIAGDFQDNGNHLNVFLADGRAGQSSLNTSVSPLNAMNGSVFGSGFSATYAIDMNDYQGTAYTSTADLVNNNGGFQGGVVLSSGIGSGILNNGIGLALNNTHVSTMGASGTALSGATSGANTTTGLELSIPLSLLGNPSGSIEVLADINGGSNGYLSNQFLPGLGTGSANLGTATFNMGSTPNEYFTVVPTPEPSSVMLAAGGVATLLFLRRRR